MFFLSQKSKKRSAIFLIGVLSFTYVFGFTLFRPAVTYAQVDVNQGVRNVTDQIANALVGAGLGALVNGASYFMRKIAYDTAKYIAAGAAGQKPLAFQEGFGEYLQNTALDSAAASIEELGKPFGLNLCKPPDLRLQIGLQVNISKIYEAENGTGEGGPTPQCSWNQFTESWKNSPDTMFNDQALLAKFNTSLKTSQGDLGAALNIFGKVDNIIAKQQLANQLDRLEGQGFKAVKDIISPNIKTPPQIIKQEASTITAAKQSEMNAGQIAGIYGVQAANILPMALSVFANTLVNSLLQNVLEKGLLPSKGDASSVANFYASTLNSNRDIAESAFSYLIAGIPQRPLSAYDVVNQYTTCDTNPGLNNCVMDGGLQQAVDRARVESALTIGEALEQNLLHANAQLIPATAEALNTDLQLCSGNTAYCQSNIEKLRKARILPLGFEIAARKSSPDNPWKLGEVVKGFNDCDPSGKPSAAYPYCKLIDPNWILKAPEARCEAQVNGPELLTPTVAERRSECVDFSTCLATDANGQCIGFGYCTQEENAWKMPGASCNAQFNTCKTYKATDGGAIASYLSRTVDSRSCSINSVGCQAYSIDKSGDQWKQTATVDPALTFAGRTQAIHLNTRTSGLQCPSSAEGCSLFVDPVVIDPQTNNNEKIYLKKAPEYLGCYDVSPETPATIDWPQTQAELTTLAAQKSPSCSQFAAACIPDEVGCQEYKPNNGGTAVTGIIGGNSCPSQCVGYETFKQEATTFESEKFPLNFIWSNAQTCSQQENGCDEFTNIGAAAAGGESLEYYTNLKHCELPKDNNGKTFYSWEGSDSQGFILKRHTLVQMTETDASYAQSLNLNFASGDSAATVFGAGSPAYVEDTGSVLQTNYTECNQTSYNILLRNPYDPKAAHPDCRAFYDSAGGIYYRLLGKTVTVSASCTPLRKTNSELFVDTNIADANTCGEKGGLWEGTQCKRCMAGGRYEVNAQGVGSCIYQSIKVEATSCSAAVNGCRSYIGNKGNNIETVASFSFEPSDNSQDALNQAKANWTGTVSIEPEATQVGLNSLRVNGQNTSHIFTAGTLTPGAWYELRFWARANSSYGLNIGFSQTGTAIGKAFTFDTLTNTSVPAPVGIEWKEYKLGPVQFTGSMTTDAEVYFKAAATGSFYFLDNVELVQIGGAASDHTFLVKNSWKTPEGYEVPLVCDATPNDGLPGTALGCRAYTRGDGQSAYLTSFDRLCRAEAVGCRAVVDTENTDGSEKQAYGVVCRKSAVVAQSSPCTVVLNESVENNPSYSCTVEKGSTECRIKTAVIIPPEPTATLVNNCISVGTSCAGSGDKLFIDSSTVVIRADSDQIYLAQQTQFTCNENQLGCMKVGIEKQNIASTASSSYTYQETFIKNDPRSYGDVLCSDNEVGCAEFKQDNSLVYFKDPKLTGNSLCVYKTNVSFGNNKTYSGWFMDGVGTCSGGSQSGKLCKANGDCGTNSTCTNIGTTACYNNYFQSENSYGLWSQGSAGYQGFVGVCDSGSNGCTELVDRAAVSADNPQGKSYYVLMNDKLKQNVGQCAGQVSQKEGCVLFDQTENPGKTYNTALSYKASVDATPSNSLVAPSTAEPKDANLILKVERDRQCSEWLACKNATTIFDKNGKPQSLCQQYAACSKLGPSGECLSWVDTSLDNTRLTEQEYIKRPTTWNSPEFSGYSLFGAFNPSNYVYFLFSTSTSANAYLAYEMSPAFFADESEGSGCREVDVSNNYVKQDGSACGFDNGGRCYSQRCFYPIDGNFTFTPNGSSETNVANMLKELQPGICKSYPEKDSPFPIAVAIDNPSSAISKSSPDGSTSRVEYPDKKDQYAKANICQPGSTSKDCSCEYIKIEYKNGVTDYWPTDTDSKVIPPGVCTSGEKEGQPCTTDIQCGGTGGTCSLKNRSSTSYGLKGLCLEYDRSRPIGLLKDTAKLFEAFECLTWLPIQVSASAIDVDNLFSDAGYNPTIDSPTGGQAYCTESTNREAGYFNSTLAGNDYLTTQFSDTLYGADGVDQLSLYDENSDLGMNVPSPSSVYFADEIHGGAGRLGVFNTIKNSYDITPPIEASEPIYNQLMSKSEGQQPKTASILYRVMQAWAWKNIGESARVLRLDTKGGDRPAYVVPARASDQNEVYSFASVGFEDTDQAGDTGVSMHPPSINLSPSTPGSYFMNSAKDINLNENGKESAVNISIAGTGALSSSFGLGSSAGTNEFIRVDGSVESQLTEGDIKNIFFVPIAYPDGSEGPNPALLTKTVKIDLANLKQVADKSYGSENANVLYTQSNVDTFNDQGSDKQHYAVLFGSAGQAMARVSYVLQRTENSTNGYGLLSHYNYSDYEPSGDTWDEYESGGQNLEIENLEIENKVVRRYVTLVFAKDVLGRYTSPFTVFNQQNQQNVTQQNFLSIPADNFPDPFIQACSGKRDNNWLAIGLDFNKDGKFLGYISRWCNGHEYGGDGEANGIRFATIAELNDICLEYTAVVNDSNPLRDFNKAWTDRVWNNSSFNFPRDSSLSDRGLLLSIKSDTTTGINPYGSLASKITATYLNSPANTPYYSFPDYTQGVPYHCGMGDGFESDTHIFNLNIGCTINNVNEATKSLSTIVSAVEQSGEKTLQNLFLKYYAVKNLLTPGPALTPDTNSNLDKSGEKIGNTTPPRIYAVNPSTCNFGTCTAAEADTFTVNSRNYTLVDYNGDGLPDEDKNRDGRIDPIIADGSYTAKIDFFAYADDNRMPIKRVMVNWGDGSPVDSVFGLYKNRKPYCASGNDTGSLGNIGRCTGSQLTCKTDTDCGLAGGTCTKETSLKFGDASRACDQKYFEHSHTYLCSLQDPSIVDVSTLQGEARDQLVSRGITKVCVFTPGVQVLDNWGWCNGTCDNGSGVLRNGCYGVDELGSMVTYSRINNEKFSQCAIKSDDFWKTDPWTYYGKGSGKIIVVPSNS